ncbi:winged helix-turn-helix transcriptional regulator [Streptomyces europaeiscabiei]|uniref:carbohydrate kinase n=1 Tax=Streptomyces TaxID=1883 RepID=UPI0015C51C85|nr:MULTISPECIES: carbohydrate kinase [Streptomyces]MDX3586227.1 winged helix-turn-helix transcriptional regulator [Streptomyces europaeiscabiei]MDX3612807.1 winged helix-turn-helix transcriptional regulator [Streptomyces europaeiscabiei]MDX3636218.1 winged helix-turn-helix transcriptional regulator [Streptomyces europaeiscabiei]MDX3654204.1 winged helix-turn-helix transcriptional regulator [Streptomyces europaeiscabiei]WUD30180.1 winged helix-turn-helix transcriptional regulator [Streptomyces 
MMLTQREREILALLRRDPLAGPQALADALGTTRTAVNVHLSNLGKKGAILGRGYIVRQENAVVVVGGANMDHKVRSLAPVTRHTSNPGRSHTSPGGVGRNIAENLARLGTPTHLIAAIGRDPAGESLLRDTQAAGVRTDHVHLSAHPTGTYTAVLDADGDLLVAVADMTATDELSPADLPHIRELVAGATMLVLDGNLATATLNYVADLAKAADVPVVIDPVSVPKAALLGPGIVPERPYFAVTPNKDELRALVNLPVGTDEEILSAAAALHDRGVTHVWVRLGPGGSVLSSAGHGHTFLPAPRTEVVDVTGAGDSMLAAFVHAVLGGAEPVEAARFGHAAAALTVAATATVRPDLSPRLVEDALNHPDGD